MIHKGSPMLQNKEKQAKGLKRIKFEILREKNTWEKSQKRVYESLKCQLNKWYWGKPKLRKGRPGYQKWDVVEEVKKKRSKMIKAMTWK